MKDPFLYAWFCAMVVMFASVVIAVYAFAHAPLASGIVVVMVAGSIVYKMRQDGEL